MNLIISIIILFAQIQVSTYEHNGKALLPNKVTTPGVITGITEKQVCSTKWGADERLVTEVMKQQVYMEYGVAHNQGICKPVSHKDKKGNLVTPKSGCEIDHLVSRELGGADDIKNLWPQPYLTPDEPGAFQKDKLENWLHKQVCSGRITLSEAQKEISTDWYEVYQRMPK